MAGGITLALVGATGMVGEAILAVLEESELVPGELFLLDEEEGAGERVRHRGKEYRVQALEGFDFSRADITLFAASRAATASHARRAAAQGSFVIDASGQLRDDETVPLIWPGVNPRILDAAQEMGIVALPSSATAQLVALLKPLQDAFGLARVDVTGLLAVSERGKAGVDELSSQAVSLFNMREVQSTVFPQQVLFNAVPQTGDIDASGYSSLERAMKEECLRLLDDGTLRLHLSLSWVPVFFGHSMSLHLQFREAVDLKSVEQVLAEVAVIEQEQAPTAVNSAANNDKLHVGRLRQDDRDPASVQLWLVADNLRFGVARGAIELVHLLEKSYV